MKPTWTILGLDLLALVCVAFLVGWEFGGDHPHAGGVVAAPGAQAATISLGPKQR